MDKTKTVVTGVVIEDEETTGTTDTGTTDTGTTDTGTTETIKEAKGEGVQLSFNF